MSFPHLGIPNQALTLVIGILPAHGLNLQTVEVHHQLIACGCFWGTGHTSFISGIISGNSSHIGIITTAHHLIIYNNLLIEVQRVDAIVGDTTHVTTAIERTEIGSIIYIGIIEYHTGFDIHCHGFHVFGELGGIRQIQRTEGMIGIAPQYTALTGIDHIGTIITHKYIVGINIWTNLQLGESVFVGIVIMERSTVTSAIDGTANDSGLCRLSTDKDGNRLGNRTERIQSLHRVTAWFIIEVIVIRIILLRFLIGIGVGTVSTTIDITFDTMIDANGGATPYLTRDIITAIDIINIAAKDSDMGWKTCLEGIAFDRRGCYILSIPHRTDISLTATAIDIVDTEGGTLGNGQQQTVMTGHATLVATGVERSDGTVHQAPGGHDGHLRLVIATKETAYLIFGTGGIGEIGIDVHLLEAFRGQQLTSFTS